MSAFDQLTRVEVVLMIEKDEQKITSMYFTDAIPENDRNAFEKSIMKSYNEECKGKDVPLFEKDGHMVLCFEFIDWVLFLVAPSHCNELILEMIANTIHNVLDELFHGKCGKDALLEKAEQVYMMLDEIFEDGFIFEISPELICSRVKLV